MVPLCDPRLELRPRRDPRELRRFRSPRGGAFVLRDGRLPWDGLFVPGRRRGQADAEQGAAE
jgi:hypothetical protein